MKQVELPLLYGNYTWANGKCVEKPDATIVAVHTNVSGVIGYLLRRVVINQTDANRNHTSYPNLIKSFQVWGGGTIRHQLLGQLCLRGTSRAQGTLP